MTGWEMVAVVACPTTESPARSASGHEGLAALSMVWLARLYRFVSRHWRLVAGTTGALLVGAALLVLTATPIYRASVLLQLDPSAPGSSFQNNQADFDTQCRLLKSRGVAREVVRSLRLVGDRRFVDNRPSGSDKSVDGSQVESVESVVDVLLSRLEVAPVHATRLVVVSLEDADPQRVEKVLTALVSTYVSRNRDRWGSSAREQLQAQVDESKADLESSEHRLHGYYQEQGVLPSLPNVNADLLRGEMVQLSEALSAARARRERLASRHRALAKVDLNDPLKVPAQELLGSSLLTQLRTTYAREKEGLERIGQSGRGPKHPTTRAAQVRTSRSREALVREIANIQGAVKSDLSAAGDEVYRVSKLLEAARGKALSADTYKLRQDQLERDKANKERAYALALEKSEEHELASMLQRNNIQVVDEVAVQPKPVKPRTLSTMLWALLLGIGLGLTLALLRERPLLSIARLRSSAQQVNPQPPPNCLDA